MPDVTFHELVINVGDIKQWAYCPRVVFYHRFYGGAGVPTAKMDMGHAAQLKIRELITRRSLRPFGFETANRKFEVWMKDVVLGIQGRADLIVSNSSQLAVIDFKLTGGGVGRNLRLQVGAYTLLAERYLGIPADRAFIFRIPDNEILPVDVNAALRAEVIQAAADIRAMIMEERLPPPTPNRLRCVDCEFANLCGDIW